jgi:hypothetical protein
MSSKKTIEGQRNNLGQDKVFHHADEFNVSWLPTLEAMWAPVGQQAMIPTPRQPYKRYGLGAVNYHTGETVVIFRQRKRREEVAELLQALLPSILINGFIWLGTIPIPMRMMRWVLLCELPVGNWFYFIYQLHPWGASTMTSVVILSVLFFLP